VSTELVQYGRALIAPFDVEIASDQKIVKLCCEEILRCLPGKRLVVRAKLGGESVIAKIFLGKYNQQNFTRERSGIMALRSANLNTPQILAEGSISGGARVLVFQYIDAANSLDRLWAEAKNTQERGSILRRSVQCIGLMHEAGIRQEDIHPGNFLDRRGEIFIIDGAAIIDSGPNGDLGESESLDNLAAFLAEFAPKYEQVILSAFKNYEAIRRLPPSANRLNDLTSRLRRRRQYRKRKYLTKIFRDCSEFHCDSTFDHFLVRCRVDDGKNLDRILRDPDLAMTSGKTLKEGNTATVKEIEVNGRKLVIKRYNIKSIFHGLRKALFTSRARRSWYNAHLMSFFEIPGAKPVALLEKRWGPFCLTSYYITESVSGPDAREFFAQSAYATEHITQLADIVVELQRCQIRHGDLKATNFIMAESSPVLIDLDSMKQYKSNRGFNRIKDRDMERFMANWQTQPALRDAFLQAFHRA
jgi:tRNA A-37 threonylcarbamoyl transferase component Bud32